MSSGRRLLWIVLLLTVVAALWPVAENDSVEGVADRPSIRQNRGASVEPSPAQRLGALRPQGETREQKIIDLFPSQSWTAPAVTAAPEKPAAPALPFVYGGRYTEGSNVFVFLSEGTKMHTVRLGDTVNSTYRIENIAPDAVTLTYLPLGLQQILQTGSTTPP